MLEVRTYKSNSMTDLRTPIQVAEDDTEVLKVYSARRIDQFSVRAKVEVETMQERVEAIIAKRKAKTANTSVKLLRELFKQRKRKC